MFHWKKITKWAFRVHSWVGILNTLLIIIFCISGMILLFRKELDRKFNPELHFLQPGKQKVPIDSIFRDLIKTYPDLSQIALHDFPEDKYDSYEFLLYKNQREISKDYLYFVFVNPYNGKVLKEGYYSDFHATFFRWLYTLHYALLLNRPGRFVTDISAILMLLSIISGIIIYRKNILKVFSFKSQVNQKNTHTINSSFHRILGVWSIPFIAVIFFSGLWLNRELLNPFDLKVDIPNTSNYLVSANIDSVLKRAKSIVGFHTIAINVPTIAGKDILVRGLFDNSGWLLGNDKGSDINFDAKTGKLIQINKVNQKPFAQVFRYALYVLHTGKYGGIIIKILYILGAFVPIYLSVSGVYL